MTINPRGYVGEYCGACRIGSTPRRSVGERDNRLVARGICDGRWRGVGRIVIIGGGPAGYEAALVAAQLGAEVTVVEAEGAGGACVLHDCVPSKTFIASSDVMTAQRDTDEFGVHDGVEATVDAGAVHRRVRRLAAAQSSDIYAKLTKAGVEFVTGHARLGEDTLGHTHQIDITPSDGDRPYSVAASTVL